MKNIKTNAMLLSLGLLVSFSVMHAADVRQEAEELKQHITAQGNNLFTPMNMFKFKNPYPTQWVALMKKVSAFVTPKTDMMSARLKTGLKASLDTSSYLTENVIKPLWETKDMQEKQRHAPILAAALTDASTPLIKAMNELQKETYRFSADKRAAKDVVEHLSAVLMTAVARVNTDAQQLAATPAAAPAAVPAAPAAVPAAPAQGGAPMAPPPPSLAAAIAAARATKDMMSQGETNASTNKSNKPTGTKTQAASGNQQLNAELAKRVAKQAEKTEKKEADKTPEQQAAEDKAKEEARKKAADLKKQQDQAKAEQEEQKRQERLAANAARKANQTTEEREREEAAAAAIEKRKAAAQGKGGSMLDDLKRTQQTKNN